MTNPSATPKSQSLTSLSVSVSPKSEIHRIPFPIATESYVKNLLCDEEADVYCVDFVPKYVYEIYEGK